MVRNEDQRSTLMGNVKIISVGCSIDYMIHILLQRSARKEDHFKLKETEKVYFLFTHPVIFATFVISMAPPGGFVTAPL